MSSRRLLLAVLALIGVVAFWVCAAQPEARQVDLATVERRAALQSFVTASGEIVATRYADIGSSAMGRVVDLGVAKATG